MINADNYQINYWEGDNTYEYDSPKPKRSLKRKLAIVFSFVIILAITPTLIYALPNLDFNQSNKVSVVNTPIQNPEPETFKVTIEEPKPSTNQTEVINNDSYWKISKRVCGTGEFYLSIQAQNDGRALYIGDIVSVNCTL